MLSKHKMSDSPSSDISSDGTMVRRTRSSSIFTIPRLFVGFSTRGLMDLDPTRSPTSPLDVKSPKSPKCSDYNTAGLGLLNYLTDEVKPGKNVLGSPLRLGSTKSLPKNYGLSSKGSPNYDLGSQEMRIRTNLVNDEFVNMRSCSADLGGLGLDLKPDLGHLKSGLNESLLGRSLPISIHSLSAREIEQSEDYTCIKSYGPNAKTTHIFGDFILEPHIIESSDNFLNTGETKGIEFSQSGLEAPNEPPHCSDIDFLSECFACEKKLDGKDVYIYRQVLILFFYILA
jgi:zinc-finger of the FCS-type, C2-C2